jgi:wyosine [tRNA(Phe)-imidazoG37] synthetase (radical SAM superfamily)
MRIDLVNALSKTSPDIITFSGMGEPTLARNLGRVIDVVREITSLPLVILTNSSLVNLESVRKDLAKLDWMIAKVDAPTQHLFEEINCPLLGTSLSSILQESKNSVRPLSEKEMIDIGREFEGLNVISVYRGQRPKVKPLDNGEELRRRGKFIE